MKEFATVVLGYTFFALICIVVGLVLGTLAAGHL